MCALYFSTSRINFLNDILSYFAWEMYTIILSYEWLDSTKILMHDVTSQLDLPESRVREIQMIMKLRIGIVHHVQGHILECQVLHAGDWPEASDYVRLGGPVRHLCPLGFRRRCDYRTSRRHPKVPIEWLIRWGWPPPRQVLAFYYIAVEAHPLVFDNSR